GPPGPGARGPDHRARLPRDRPATRHPRPRTARGPRVRVRVRRRLRPLVRAAGAPRRAAPRVRARVARLVRPRRHLTGSPDARGRRRDCRWRVRGPVRYGLRPLLRSQVRGSMPEAEPEVWTSRWRWAPLELPVESSRPMNSPVVTFWPARSLIGVWWAYQISVPSSRVSTVV